MPPPNHVRCPHCQAPLPPGAPAVCPACGRHVGAAEPEGPLAGSPDDRGVTLVPSQDDSTLTAARRRGGDSSAAWQRLLDADAAGRYVESGHIARGGMGEIVLCIDRNIRRPVALKRILAETADDPARRARFVEEAQVTGQLEHPNIVPVHELDRAADGSLYFTMKLVKGRSLADLLQAIRAAGPLPPGEGARRSSPPGEPARAGEGAANAPEHSLSDLLHIFLKVCDGVAFAHSRGVVHRDLKPANIMVGDFGEVLVMDWGLAKIVGREDIRAADLVTSDRADSTPELTLDGTAMGTPAYMPPEQANGELDKIDHRSDIYSLGAILYEILTGEKPVEGATPLVVLANAAHGQIIPPEQRTSGRAIPRELSAIAMKCLHKLRSRRYQSVTDLQRDITLYLEGRSVTAAPDTFAQAVVKLVKRNKGISASVAAAAVILIAVTASFVIRLKRQRDLAVASKRRAVENQGKAVAAEKERRDTALRASEALAREAVRATDEGRYAVAQTRADLGVAVMPDGPWGYYARGFVACQKRDLATAREHLEEALRQEPRHDLSKALLDTVLTKSGQLRDYEALLARADRTNDWRTLIAAGDAFFDARRYPDAERAFSRALSLVEPQAAVPAAVKAAVRRKLGRAVARIAVTAFWPSVRDLPAQTRAHRTTAKLKEIYGRDAPLSVHTLGDGPLAVKIGGGEVRWLDPLEGLPISRLAVAKHKGLSDLTPLRGMPLRQLEIQETAVADLGPLKGAPLTRLKISFTRVTDLSPLRDAPLTHLTCDHTRIADLSPLKDTPLEHLDMHNCTRFTDLSPLAGLPLEVLILYGTGVADLAPLAGLKLRKLTLHRTQVSDLGPLKGMPLAVLDCGDTPVRDLTPLQDMSLTVLCFPARHAIRGTNVVRSMKSLRQIGWDPKKLLSPDEFWRKYDAGKFRK